MDPQKDMPGESSCTTCQFSEDFSNYWTAVLYFKSRNETYKRVPQLANAGFEGAAGGGMTVYYMQDALYDTAQKDKVSAFKPVSQTIHFGRGLIRARDFGCSLETSTLGPSNGAHASVN